MLQNLKRDHVNLWWMIVQLICACYMPVLKGIEFVLEAALQRTELSDILKIVHLRMLCLDDRLTITCSSLFPELDL